MKDFQLRIWDGTLMAYFKYKKPLDLSRPWDGTFMIYFDFEDLNHDGTDGLEVEWGFSDSKIMPYIGIYDKLGLGIYEGDILEGLGVVEYIKDEARYGINILDELNEVTFSELESEDLKIIGNIYENPELLKELWEIE